MSGAVPADCLTSAQMRAVERAAMASGAVTGRTLMERAGRGVVEALRARRSDLVVPGQRAVVLCGPGNNGGDGYVIARLLREAGLDVGVFGMGAIPDLPPDARANAEVWRELGEIASLEVVALPADGAPVLVIDSLFGIGQRGPLDDVLAPVHRAVGRCRGAVFMVAVDVPTGYDADAGTMLAAQPLSADLIVTFHRAKPAHRMPPLADTALVVAGIGL
ncbi:Bifunctional NAD(P)H-hydrate repair enzyme Nnr [Sulfitobacter sp. THAF37]|uniref:NAD(P)H-hydrate epimerase n=1 Tax=Sulfitobacter sp. THAF37 TaxID=2587855 RepID=UPI001268A785|nr:Bifunctional NAD(P)H-hydrate repair enzyme Nnr [Sulfitobacter sp. THAF37]